MNLLLDIITYLNSRAIVLGDGIDCFRDSSPETPDNVITFLEYSGGHSQPGVECVDRYVQIQIRNTSYEGSRLLAMRIYNELNRPTDPIMFLTGVRWAVINGKASPVRLRQDTNERTIFYCELKVTTFND